MEASSAEASASPAIAASQYPLPSTDSVIEIGDHGGGRPHSSKHRQRTRRACYPCSKRKIKCDRDERVPCTNCSKRPNAELCAFDDDRPRSARPRHSNTGTASPTPASLTGDELNHERTPPQNLRRSLQQASSHFALPDHERKLQTSDPPRSIASLEHNPLIEPKPGVSLARYSLLSDSTSHSPLNPSTSTSTSAFANIQPQPRMSNGTHVQFPGPSALAANTLKGPSDELRSLLPPVKHVIKYCDLYQKTCQVLYPVDVGLPHVEELVFQYIHRSLGDRLLSFFETKNIPAMRTELINVALLCAGIAAGIQISDVEDGERRMLVKQYVSASLKLLRFADAQNNGVLAAYPIMLILARVIQDEQDPLLAFTMFGTAARNVSLSTISNVVPEALNEDGTRLRSPDNIMIVRRRQESFLAVLLGQTRQLDRPSFPNLRNQAEATYLDGIDFFAAVAAFCENEHIGREDVLIQHFEAMQAIQPFPYSAQQHLSDKSLCRNQHELLQHCVLQIYSSLVQMHFCQVIMAGCRFLPGHEDKYFETGRLCQEKARVCVEAYLDLLGFSIVALRSWILTAATIRAALILGASLAERSHTIAEAQPDRDRMNRLLHAFTTVHEEAQVDRARWLSKYRPAFDKIREMSELSAKADGPPNVMNGHAPPGVEHGTMLHRMSREDRDAIMLPQRMAQRYLATTLPDESASNTPLLSQQSLWNI